MPWQVLGEFIRKLRYWVDVGQMTKPELRRYVRLYRRHFPLLMPTAVIVDRALDLADQHTLSHWDSMLVAACLEAGVTTLYTEDMGSPRVIESLRLENPFI